MRDIRLEAALYDLREFGHEEPLKRWQDAQDDAAENQGEIERSQ